MPPCQESSHGGMGLPRHLSHFRAVSRRRAGRLPGVGYALQSDLTGPGHHAPVARGNHDGRGPGFACAEVSCGREHKSADTAEHRGVRVAAASSR